MSFRKLEQSERTIGTSEDNRRFRQGIAKDLNTTSESLKVNHALIEGLERMPAVSDKLAADNDRQ